MSTQDETELGTTFTKWTVDLTRCPREVAGEPGGYAGEGRVPAWSRYEIGEERAGCWFPGPRVGGLQDPQGVGNPDGGPKGDGVHFWLQEKLKGGIPGGVRVLPLRLGPLCRVWAGNWGGFPGVGCRIVFCRGLLYSWGLLRFCVLSGVLLLGFLSARMQV